MTACSSFSARFLGSSRLGKWVPTVILGSELDGADPRVPGAGAVAVCGRRCGSRYARRERLQKLTSTSMIIWTTDRTPSLRMSESSSLRSLPTNGVRSILSLAIPLSCLVARPNSDKEGNGHLRSAESRPQISKTSRDANPAPEDEFRHGCFPPATVPSGGGGSKAPSAAPPSLS